jgi:hypothetical protein
MAVDCTILAFVQFGSIALANPTYRHCGVLDKTTNEGSQAGSHIFTDTAVTNYHAPATNKAARYLYIQAILPHAVDQLPIVAGCNRRHRCSQIQLRLRAGG